MSLTEVLPKVLRPGAVMDALRALRRPSERPEADQIAQRFDRLSDNSEARLPRRGYIKG